MGSRRTGNSAEHIYAAAETWAARGLLADDSLFMPGEAIWSPRWLGELRVRFLDNTDAPCSDFYDKLQAQLADSPPDVYQLMGEALFVNFLIVHHSAIRRDTKEERINQVLGWSPASVPIPSNLASVLSSGFVHPGQGFLSKNRPNHLGFLIVLAEQLKAMSTSDKRDGLLKDSWGFKAFSEHIQFHIGSMQNAAMRRERKSMRRIISSFRIRLKRSSLTTTIAVSSKLLGSSWPNPRMMLTASSTRFITVSRKATVEAYPISMSPKYAPSGMINPILPLRSRRGRSM